MDFWSDQVQLLRSYRCTLSSNMIYMTERSSGLGVYRFTVCLHGSNHSLKPVSYWW